MTLRFSERYVMALNLLLIAVAAYFLALSVNDIVLARISSGAPPRIPSLGAASRNASGAHPRSYYDAISRRDIFNLEPAPEAPTVAAANLHIRLVGTSSLTLSQPFIIVEDQTNHEQSLYRLGDEIPDTGKLVGVYKDHAVILSQGKRIRLDMPADQNALPVQPFPHPFGLHSRPRPFRGPVPGGRIGRNNVREIRPHDYVLDRSTVDNNLNNMASLFTQMRAIPNLGPDGRSNGFRLSEIQPDSIFQQIGLRDGDVLTGVSGQSISDPAKAIQVLSSLRNQNSINVTVLRAGQPLQLQYNIR
jgi:general secretion pathway protein C